MHDEEWDETTKRQEFEKLVRANQTGLLGFLVSLTGNLADSEDLAQECITVLGKKFNEFEKGTNFGAWVRRTELQCLTFPSSRGMGKGVTCLRLQVSTEPMNWRFAPADGRSVTRFPKRAMARHPNTYRENRKAYE